MPIDTPSDKFLTDEARWQQLLSSLRGEGWTAVVTCHAAPVQLEGTVPTGESFYFRCRWKACSLGIGGEDPVDAPAWENEVTLKDGASASYLPPDDAARILLMLHARWLSQVDDGVLE